MLKLLELKGSQLFGNLHLASCAGSDATSSARAMEPEVQTLERGLPMPAQHGKRAEAMTL